MRRHIENRRKWEMVKFFFMKTKEGLVQIEEV